MAKTTHDMVQDSETATEVVFKCAACERKIGVPKPAKGNAECTSDIVQATIGLLCDK